MKHEVTLAVVDGTPRALSTDIAEHFGKQHRSVLLSIDNLTKELPADRLHNFVQTVVSRENPSGGAPIETRAFHLTRDGFTLLAMGFTGKRALQFKLAYIDAFNKMEAELAGKQPLPPLPYKEQPGQSLSEEQCAELRKMLTTKCETLPSAQRAEFMVKGWSRLKAHFGCMYRKIPAARFEEARDLIARHIADFTAPAPELPIDPFDADAMNAARRAAIDWFCGKSKEPDNIPHEVLQGLVAQALMSRRFLLDFSHWRGKWRAGIFTLDKGDCLINYDTTSAATIAENTPRHRVPEIIAALAQRITPALPAPAA